MGKGIPMVCACTHVHTLNVLNYTNWLEAKDSGPERNRQKLKVISFHANKNQN